MAMCVTKMFVNEFLIVHTNLPTNENIPVIYCISPQYFTATKKDTILFFLMSSKQQH